MRKLLIAALVWTSLAGLLGLGLVAEPRHWLQTMGWGVLALVFLGGSARLIWLRLTGQRISGGQLGFYPRSWQRWLLDQPRGISRA